MMNVYFDTEFTELSKDGQLISIGLIGQNTAKDKVEMFYAEFNDYETKELSDFVQDNVIPNLILTKQKPVGIQREVHPYYEITNIYGNKEEVKKALIDWLEHFQSDIMLVSDVAHYDMILFIDIFGTAFDIPKFICPAVYDINQDILKYMNSTLKEAFDMNREKLLNGLIEGNHTSLVELYRKFGKEMKHNSLYDAIVIYLLYLNLPYTK